MTKEIDETERRMIQACDAAIDKLEAEFHAHPLTFFSELDVQRHYCAILESEFEKRRLPTTLINLDGERVAILHQDYGSAQGKGHRTDVVVLRPRELPASRGIEMRVGDRYAQPLVALEIGTEKSEQKRFREKGSDLCAHTERDFEKLDKTGAVECRLVICYRDRSALTRRKKDQLVLEERLTRLRECVDKLGHTYPKTRVRLIIERLPS